MVVANPATQQQVNFLTSSKKNSVRSKKKTLKIDSKDHVLDFFNHSEHGAQRQLLLLKQTLFLNIKNRQ